MQRISDNKLDNIHSDRRTKYVETEIKLKWEAVSGI